MLNQKGVQHMWALFGLSCASAQFVFSLTFSTKGSKSCPQLHCSCSIQEQPAWRSFKTDVSRENQITLWVLAVGVGRGSSQRNADQPHGAGSVSPSAAPADVHRIPAGWTLADPLRDPAWHVNHKASVPAQPCVPGFTGGGRRSWSHRAVGLPVAAQQTPVRSCSSSLRVHQCITTRCIRWKGC